MHELFDNYVIPEDRNAYWNGSLSIFNIIWCYCKGNMAGENACNAGYLNNWYLPTTRHPPPPPWPILCLLPWRWVRRHCRLHSHIVLALVAEGPKESKQTTGKNNVILEVYIWQPAVCIAKIHTHLRARSPLPREAYRIEAEPRLFSTFGHF